MSTAKAAPGGKGKWNWFDQEANRIVKSWQNAPGHVTLQSVLAIALRRAEKRGYQARQKYDQDVRMGKVAP